MIRLFDRQHTSNNMNNPLKLRVRDIIKYRQQLNIVNQILNDAHHQNEIRFQSLKSAYDNVQDRIAQRVSVQTNSDFRDLSTQQIHHFLFNSATSQEQIVKEKLVDEMNQIEAFDNETTEKINHNLVQLSKLNCEFSSNIAKLSIDELHELADENNKYFGFLNQQYMHVNLELNSLNLLLNENSHQPQKQEQLNYLIFQTNNSLIELSLIIRLTRDEYWVVSNTIQKKEEQSITPHFRF